MPRSGCFAVGLFCAVFCCAAGSLFAQSVKVHCDNAVHASLCAALQGALEQSAPQRMVSVSYADAPTDTGHLVVWFQPKTWSPSLISGQLVWRDSKGTEAAGPLLDMAILDGSKTTGDLDAFARILVQFSPIPL